MQIVRGVEGTTYPPRRRRRGRSGSSTAAQYPICTAAAHRHSASITGSYRSRVRHPARRTL